MRSPGYSVSCLPTSAMLFPLIVAADAPVFGEDLRAEPVEGGRTDSIGGTSLFVLPSASEREVPGTGGSGADVQ